MHALRRRQACTPSSPCARTNRGLQVAYLPAVDGSVGDVQGGTFSFPRVKRDELVAEAARLHAARQAKLMNALADKQAPLLAGGLTRKNAVVVRPPRPCGHTLCVLAQPRPDKSMVAILPTPTVIR